MFCKQCGEPGAKTDKFCKVCGEQINLDSIDSIPDNNIQQIIPANRMRRLCARLLDIVFGFVSALIPGFVVTFLSDGSFNPESFLLGAGVGIISFVIYQWYLLATTAQTIGKKYLKIKIVKIVTIQDGYPTVEQAGFFVNVVLREWVMTLIGLFPAIGGIIQIVDILFIFRDDRKCIHDLIAGTVVIKIIE